MAIRKITQPSEIHLNSEISALVKQCLHNPTDGKIQSIAQAIYSKTQGVFFVYEIDQKPLGIIGGTEIDGTHLIIKHLAIHPEHRRKGIGRKLIQHLIDSDRYNSIFTESETENIKFFKALGFKCTGKEDPILETTILACEWHAK